MTPTPHPFLSIVTLAIVVATSGCSARTLLADVPPSEAQRCAVVLRSSGVEVTVERDEGGGSDTRRLMLHGDDADYSTALQVLEEHNLPHRQGAGFSSAPSALIPTPTEERSRYIKELSGEIESMLESVDGVVAAEALVSIPERRPLTIGAPEPATASVVVAHTADAAPVTIDEVRALVVQCVGATLQPERVTVILKPVVRPGTTKPIVRYQRDRSVELAFLGVVAAISAAEFATLYFLRRERLRHTEEHDAPRIA